jgi:alkyldihydroxyacetonephosphate synthase
MQARPAKWWGWGFEDRSVPLESKPALLALLRQVLELPETDLLRVPDPATIRLPTPRLSDAELAEFRKIVGEEGIAGSDRDRLTHGIGRSYRDLVRLRLGPIPPPPDLVVFPEADEDVRRLLEFCSEREVRVIPFGGGTSVVGGVEVVDPSRPHVTIDLRRMRRVLAVDEMSLLATAQAGIRGPLLEEELQGHRLTTGHIPQSFEFSTLGGWIAARSTGALSNRYGKIEDLVAGLRLIAPSGVYDMQARPRHAMGPDLLGLAVGSEGALGVITQATIRVHRAPEARAFESVRFRGFHEGLEALRGMVQEGVPPHMAYLMDEDETRLAIATAGGSAGRGAPTTGGSLLLMGYEGARAVVRDHLATGRTYCGAGAAAGAGPAERWFHERYDAPYLRDSMIDHRIMVDTVETATVWSNLERLYDAAKKALLNGIWGTGVQGLVGCHVSHVYTEGASLYFTFLARQKRGEELPQYDAVKSSVTRAILDHGGHLSHHHGVGVEHAKYLREAIGDASWQLLRSLKRTLDPKGIMNPGKVYAVGA